MLILIRKIFYMCFCLNSLLIYSQSNQISNSPELWLFNNNIQDSLHLHLNGYKNLDFNKSLNWYSINKFKKNNFLFIVFKSENEEPIFSVIGKKRSFFMNTDSFQLKTQSSISGYNQNYGELIDFRLGSFDDNVFWLNNKSKNLEIYEIILDQNLSEFSVNQIRTYLSLKYGIDLLNYKQYVYKNDNELLWQKCENNYNIIGLARFDYFNFFQTKTIHSKNKDVMFKFSSAMLKEDLNDGDYVLLGDNNKTSKFIKNINQKTWTTQSNINTNVDFIWKIFEDGDESVYDYHLVNNGEVYVSQQLNSNILFKNVKVSNGTNNLYIKRVKSDFDIKISTQCNKSRLSIKNLTKNNTEITYKIYTENNEILSSGIYLDEFEFDNKFEKMISIEIENNKKKFYKSIEINYDENPLLNIKDHYLIDDFTFENIIVNDSKIKSIKWFKDNKYYSDDYNFKLNEIGNYNVQIVYNNECVIDKSFSVTKNIDNSYWNIYPNPVNVNEKVNIEFFYKEYKEISLMVYQEDGKLVKSIAEFNTEFKNKVDFQLSSTGVYLIVAYIDGNLEIKKLIVK